MSGAGHTENTGSPKAAGRNRGRKKAGVWLVPALAGACLVLFLMIEGPGPLWLDDPLVWWRKLIRPLLRLLVFISIGLLAGQLLEGLGLSARIGALMGPLFKSARLPDEAGAAFAASFASGVTANSILYTSWQEGKLNRKQLVLANLLNASLPAFFVHLPSVFFVVYALLGNVALIYFGIMLFAACLRFCLVILMGNLLLPVTAPAQSALKGPSKKNWPSVWRDTWQKFSVRLKRLLIIIVPVYILIFILAQVGFFPWLGQALASFVSSEILPVEAMSVVVFSIMAEFTSGFAAAAALLGAGSLSVSQAVLALCLGNLAATPVRVLRHQLPHYMGIYSPRLGLSLLCIGQTARIISVLAAMAVFFPFI